MVDLIAISFYCMAAMIRTDGYAELSQCYSIDPLRKSEFWAEKVQDMNGHICKVRIHGTESTSWPDVVDAYTPCILLDIRKLKEK